MYKNKIDDIMSRELTRQEFLKAGTALILTLIGLPAIINAITHTFAKKEHSASLAGSSGYGGRPYGR